MAQSDRRLKWNHSAQWLSFLLHHVRKESPHSFVCILFSLYFSPSVFFLFLHAFSSKTELSFRACGWMPSCTALLYWTPMRFTRQNGQTRPNHEGNNCVVFSFLLRLLGGKIWRGTGQGRSQKTRRDRKQRQKYVVPMLVGTLYSKTECRVVWRAWKQSNLDEKWKTAKNTLQYHYKTYWKPRGRKTQQKIHHLWNLLQTTNWPSAFKRRNKSLNVRMLTRSTSVWHGPHPDLFLGWIMRNKYDSERSSAT